jgi:RNA polymerase sigma-70 factor, ECF subfamily
MMPELDRRNQFEAVLTEEVYRTAWCYAKRLCAPLGTIHRAEAEDLLQEALLRAYQRFQQLRDPGRFKGWLLSILRSCHLDRLRRSGHPLEAVSELPDGILDRNADPQAEMLFAALRCMPAAQRELLCLFYLEDLNVEETGQVLGLSAVAVRQRLCRARGELRRQLNSLGQAYESSIPTPQIKEGLLP